MKFLLFERRTFYDFPFLLAVVPIGHIMVRVVLLVVVVVGVIKQANHNYNSYNVMKVMLSIE